MYCSIRSRWLAVCVMPLLLIACAQKPLASDSSQPVSHALDASTPTAFKKAIAPAVLAHPGQSGFHLLVTGEAALEMRIALIQAADKAIDLQYYSIHDDRTGKLLLYALLKAAERGVHIRLIIDDINLKGSDKALNLLNGHKNIEIKSFNPIATREDSFITRASRYITDLDQYTRRMHNKALIVDNQVAVAGGRNLGDEYFDANSEFNFRDVDVVAAGPVTTRISHSFDTYWNSDQTYPLAQLKKPLTPKQIADTKEELRAHWQEAVHKPEGGRLEDTSLPEKLANGDVSLIWAKAELAVDKPDKIEKPEEDTQSPPANKLLQLSEHAKGEIILVSPYFVPQEDGLRWIESLEQRGVRMRILTNSLGATDVVAVHTGYRRYREDLLKAGAELYEFKPDPKQRPRNSIFGSSSKASLHTKVYIVDRRELVIGSFNLDPRSVELNTELALVIHSPELAAQVAKLFEKAATPAESFHVMLLPARYELLGMPVGGVYDHLFWFTEENGKNVYFVRDPKAGLWRNLQAELFSLLPIEDQL